MQPYINNTLPSIKDRLNSLIDAWNDLEFELDTARTRAKAKAIKDSIQYGLIFTDVDFSELKPMNDYDFMDSPAYPSRSIEFIDLREETKPVVMKYVVKNGESKTYSCDGKFKVVVKHGKCEIIPETRSFYEE